MKKLLIATDNFIPRHDGIAVFLREATPYLKKYFKITILAPNFGIKKSTIREEFKGIKLVLFDLSHKKYGDYPPARISLRKISREVKKADIVWSHGLLPISLWALFFGWVYKKKRISQIHSIEYELGALALKKRGMSQALIRQTIKLLLRIIYNLSSKIIVPSFEVAQLIENLGVNKDKFIVGMGIDVKKFKPAKNKKNAKKKLGIKEDKIVIGYCNRLSYEKDPLTLLRAFEALRREHKNIILLVVGSGIKELERKFKGRKDVKFVGDKDNVIPYLQAMDFFVLTSLTETSSLSTMEAMSCGAVPIATKVGVVKFYIKDGFNGFFFEKRNDRDLMNKLAKAILLYENDKKEFMRMSKRARLTIIKKFQFKNTIETIKNILLKS